MKFVIEHITENPVSLMRRAGYVFQHEKDGEQSYVRVLARAGFPRFHCYLKREGKNLLGSMHLDQKKETYGQVTRHHGEYEGDGVLQEEIERLRTSLAGFKLLA